MGNKADIAVSGNDGIQDVSALVYTLRLFPPEHFCSDMGWWGSSCVEPGGPLVVSQGSHTRGWSGASEGRHQHPGCLCRRSEGLYSQREPMHSAPLLFSGYSSLLVLSGSLSSREGELLFCSPGALSMWDQPVAQELVALRAIKQAGALDPTCLGFLEVYLKW